MKDIAKSLVGETSELSDDGKWTNKHGSLSDFFLAAPYEKWDEAWSKVQEEQNKNTSQAIADLLIPAKLR